MINKKLVERKINSILDDLEKLKNSKTILLTRLLKTTIPTNQ